MTEMTETTTETEAAPALEVLPVEKRRSLKLLSGTLYMLHHQLRDAGPELLGRLADSLRVPMRPELVAHWREGVEALRAATTDAPLPPAPDRPKTMGE